MGGNEAGEIAVCELLEGLREATALKVLEIGGNTMGGEAERILKEIAVSNPGLDVARDIPERNQSDNIVSKASVDEAAGGGGGGGEDFAKGGIVNMRNVNKVLKEAGWKVG